MAENQPAVTYGNLHNMRVTYPTAWPSMNTQERTAWWEKNVNQPFAEAMRMVAENEGTPMPEVLEKIRPTFAPKSLADEVAELRAIKRTADRSEREAEEWGGEDD